MRRRIPFSQPFLTGNEATYVSEAIADRHLGGDGPFTRRAEALLERLLSARRVLLTTSGTAALEMAALLCDLAPGDEVLMPSYTFTSTANAFLMRGARPVFVDISPETLNIDPALAAAAVTERTRAIVPVHYAGVGCDMDALLELAGRHGLIVVEDAAQGVNSTWRDRPLGSIGDIGALSFHATKNFVCGEGGALVCNDGALVERAEILREKGTNRSKFIRGQVDKYTWVDVGSSFVPAELVAAFLCAQLEAVDLITAERKRVFETYTACLSPLESSGLLRLPVIPETCRPNYHMMYVVAPDAATRTAMLEHLNDRGYQAVFHYVPLHASPMGRKLGYSPGMFPVTEAMSERLLRLPFYPELADEQIREIGSEIAEFFGQERQFG